MTNQPISYDPSKPMSARELLKLEIDSERSVYFLGAGKYPLCPFCGRPVRVGKMPEGLISRDQVTGHPEQDRIYSKYNCVIVHRHCHRKIQGVGGGRAFHEVANYPFKWEGSEEVVDWLRRMKLYFPVVAEQTLKRLGYLGG